MLDSPQHFAGMAFASSVVLAVLAACFAAGHRLRRPWGLAWLSAWAVLSALRGLLAAVFGGTPADQSPAWIWADVALGGAALVALAVGLRAYVGRPWQRAWRWMAALGMALFGLVVHPAIVPGLGASLLGLPADPLRGGSALALALLGLAILVAIGQRLRLDMQRELDARLQVETELRLLNQSLEKRVQVRTRHLEELVEGLESFNRMVSHDLRGPLSSIVGILQLADRSLQRHDLAQVGRWMGLVDGEARRLIGLVHRMLLLARASSAELDRSAVSLEDLLKDALQALALGRGGRPLDAVTFDSLPKAAVDAQLMRQVFINLVDNALKFAGAAVDARVHVSATRRPGSVVVEVRDNGPGFASDRAKDLFQPFKRLHGSGYEGSGIGLTIVRRIVERHGGKVWAEGRPAQGASFFFSVPAAAAA